MSNRMSISVAGVHLSGPNANKTSLTVLRAEGPLRLKIGKVYEKIGAFGSLFSDERLVEILTHGGPFAEVFVDCPLTVPPCVACQRPLCPGAVKCDDVSVAYMLKVSGRVRRRGARKARPINPQSQRLWDVLQLDNDESERLEPSYSANLAPLVARARTLQRRLNSLDPAVVLKETSVQHALESLRLPLSLEGDLRGEYRNFEVGLDRRQQIVDRMVDKGWILAEDEDDELQIERVTGSVETFHSFIAAWVAARHLAGATHDRPHEYVEGEGWVHLPRGIEP